MAENPSCWDYIQPAVSTHWSFFGIQVSPLFWEPELHHISGFVAQAVAPAEHKAIGLQLLSEIVLFCLWVNGEIYHCAMIPYFFGGV